VSRAIFDEVLHAHPEIYRELTIILARRLRDIDDAIAATSFLSVKGRAARALLIWRGQVWRFVTDHWLSFG
jgi:CRP/FNR family cyclic AMP-dependent transcriptional regulator